MDSASTRSTTAEGAAFCRAVGAFEPEPGLRNPDQLAHHFVTRAIWKLFLLPGLRHLASRQIERMLPGAIVLMQARTRVFDELILTAGREGALQLVILGAGADSRAYRLRVRLPSVRVFEVDHPETGAWKQQRVLRMLGHLPDHVRHVAVNLESDALDSALQSAGFDWSAITFFLWEGVSMYLRPAAIDAVLSVVARTCRGSAIAFDYMYADAVAHPDRFEGATAHTEYVASRGEPFTFGLPREPSELTSFVAARGLELAQSWDHRQLRAVYPGGGFLMPYVGVVHARVPQGRLST
jgi:methyltransferase (TIGR00027 family)